jgi:hypothetical protein
MYGFLRQHELVALKFFTRKRKAVKKWHSRAMLIDLRKTKLTIVYEKK